MDPSYVIVTICVGFSAIFVWAVSRLIQRQLTKRWPKVEGEVLGSELVAGGYAPRGKPAPEFQIEYSYSVRGRIYRQRELAPPEYIVWSNGFTRKLRTLAQGAEIPVHVDPRDPTRATVAPGSREKNAVLVLMMSGGVFAASVWVLLHF